MKILVLFCALAFVFTSCKDSKSSYSQQKSITESTNKVHPGKTAMETHCYVCHAPEKPQPQVRIAPSMVMVQNHYIKKNTTKEQFTKEFISFLEEPSEAKAKMPGAVRNFGLMPYQKFPKDVLEQIADYLFEYNPIDEDQTVSSNKAPQSSMNQEKSREDTSQLTQEQKAEIGLKYALETKQLLGQNLMGAIQKNGTLHALEFCNVEAMPLTAQMQEKFGADIQRVSNKNRNPNNAANEEETYYINFFQKEIDEGNDPKPVVLSQDGKTRFYYPIVTNTMCLQCHGKPNIINTEVLLQIKDLYPNDLATGYDENEVRGIWSIGF